VAASSRALDNAATQKLSPELTLSEPQTELLHRVMSFCERHQADDSALFVIEGTAGTGKSVVLNAIFNALQTWARSGAAGDPLKGLRNMLIVNHPEMLKLYRNIAATMPALRKSDYERPTTFINTSAKTGRRMDIVLVDEAHLLLTRPDRYNHFTQQNHLEEILRWDRSLPREKLPWAERPDTIDEVGSVYTIQGFDLNYAGVILGPSLFYDVKHDRIGVRPERYEDSAAFQGRDGIAAPEEAKTRVILNALNVILTRGIHGLFLYAHDPALRERLLRT